LTSQAGGNLRFTYRHTVQGFAATLPPQALEGIRGNPNVALITPDGVALAVETETADSWGLDRIDQRDLPLSNTYTYTTDGSGVDVYILDTGIRTSHDEFGGRAVKTSEADFIGGTGDDCHGHGTHVAGTVGGINYGVAKGVTLHAVRVLGCDGSGSISGVIAGVDWVTGQHQAGGGPSVANMSLSAYDPIGWFQVLNDAVAASVAAGVVYAVAASNDNDNACYYSPASEPQALTVGATNSSDTRAYFSNYGSCLDLFAPGVGITSAVNTSDGATATWSGTSMASPHVAGVAALFLGENETATPAAVMSHILSNTTDGLITDPGPSSPNKLLYSLITGDPGPDPTPPNPPSGLAATAASHTQIDLTWTDNSSDENGFEIERGTDGTNFGWIADVGANVTGYSDTELTPSTTYHYRVRAKNGAGSSAYSSSASATTDPGPPPSEDVVAVVWRVSEVDEVQNGKFQNGMVAVAVADANKTDTEPGFFLVGVTVTGDWYKDGDSDPFRSTSAVTEDLGLDNGIALLESGRIKNPPGASLHFCVTSLSGPGFSDGGGDDEGNPYPICDPDFTPPSQEDPPSGAPSGLQAFFTSKGGGRVELSWTPGGGAEVFVYRGGVHVATTADNGRYNDRGGEAGMIYQVCAAETGPGDPDNCTGSEPANGGG
jgi:subtilisin family serine protease